MVPSFTKLKYTIDDSVDRSLISAALSERSTRPRSCDGEGEDFGHEAANGTLLCGGSGRRCEGVPAIYYPLSTNPTSSGGEERGHFSMGWPSCEGMAGRDKEEATPEGAASVPVFRRGYRAFVIEPSSVFSQPPPWIELCHSYVHVSPDSTPVNLDLAPSGPS